MKWTKLTAENIPDEEVLCMGYQEELLIGLVEDDEGFFCESDHEVLVGVTHFISLKDLWNLERE